VQEILGISLVFREMWDTTDRPSDVYELFVTLFE
jgi:hypothetical protein